MSRVQNSYLGIGERGKERLPGSLQSLSTVLNKFLAVDINSPEGAKTPCPNSALYTVQCVHTKHTICSVFTLSVYSVHTPETYSLHRAVYIVHFSVYIVQSTVYSEQCTVYSVQSIGKYAVCSMQYSVQCAVCSVQCSVYNLPGQLSDVFMGGRDSLTPHSNHLNCHRQQMDTAGNLAE